MRTLCVVPDAAEREAVHAALGLRLELRQSELFGLAKALDRDDGPDVVWLHGADAEAGGAGGASAWSELPDGVAAALRTWVATRGGGLVLSGTASELAPVWTDDPNAPTVSTVGDATGVLPPPGQSSFWRAPFGYRLRAHDDVSAAAADSGQAGVWPGRDADVLAVATPLAASPRPALVQHAVGEGRIVTIAAPLAFAASTSSTEALARLVTDVVDALVDRADDGVTWPSPTNGRTTVRAAANRPLRPARELPAAASPPAALLAAGSGNSADDAARSVLLVADGGQALVVAPDGNVEQLAGGGLGRALSLAFESRVGDGPWRPAGATVTATATPSLGRFRVTHDVWTLEWAPFDDGFQLRCSVHEDASAPVAIRCSITSDLAPRAPWPRSLLVDTAVQSATKGAELAVVETRFGATAWVCFDRIPKRASTLTRPAGGLLARRQFRLAAGQELVAELSCAGLADAVVADLALPTIAFGDDDRDAAFAACRGMLVDDASPSSVRDDRARHARPPLSSPDGSAWATTGQPLATAWRAQQEFDGGDAEEAWRLATAILDADPTGDASTAAALCCAFVDGLLGWRAEAGALPEFAPRLPSALSAVAFDELVVGDTTLRGRIERLDDGTRLTLQSDGPAVTLRVHGTVVRVDGEAEHAWGAVAEPTSTADVPAAEVDVAATV